MKTFGDKITLAKNGRGCYILDTVKGCSALADKPGGCYGDCYANRIASRYRIDFANPVSRCFEVNTIQPSLFGFDDDAHLCEVINGIKKADMPFIRIGDMGDPSENWEHTIDVCKQVSIAGKPIVIITKHWHTIPDKLLEYIDATNICINTSISALDSSTEIEHRLTQYNRLKPYCKSVLRIVSCNFNNTSNEGYTKNEMQKYLFDNEHVIDTVFRPSASNRLVVDKIINTERVGFLKSTTLASIYNTNAYLGYCKNCPDLCGIS